MGIRAERRAAIEVSVPIGVFRRRPGITITDGPVLPAGT